VNRISAMRSPASDWDVIVVGAGHAGCEAALAAARMGRRVLLLAANRAGIARMPCNPAIGGLAKSHLVSEIDALGGEMGVDTDLAGIQFRTLNLSRGPSVQATRAQCDKRRYSLRMRQVLERTPGLDLLEDMATAILHTGDRLHGVATIRHGELHASAVVLATGTALGGRIFIGRESLGSDGDGRAAAEALSANLQELGMELRRLKTGTPARLDAATIDWSVLARQPGDNPPPLFSWKGRQYREQCIRECSTWNIPAASPLGPLPLDQDEEALSKTGGTAFIRLHCKQIDECSTWNNPFASLRIVPRGTTGEHLPPRILPKHIDPPLEWCPGADQEDCFETHTTRETHRIVRDNLPRSALYGGSISGTGVRYCPSIEDKVVRFEDRDSHHVILEPESRNGRVVYPNGLSNSLPRDTQHALVRSVPGLERAEILAFAYAIEYDALDPRQLRSSLEFHGLPGLFCAGQINGTTGYEEAAAQGLLAGINAALFTRNEQAILLSRQNAYIGVLIDDLVTKGTDEPYRMFTSRAERRLLLRQDNARFRLLRLAKEIGLAPPAFLAETESYQQLVNTETDRLRTTRFQGRTLEELLRRPEVSHASLPIPPPSPLPSEVIRQVTLQVKYHGYIEQEKRSAERAKRDERLTIPHDFDYHSVQALRYETREKLDRIRPENLAQALRISGVTPADVAILSVLIQPKRHPDRE
jgi:tRNA uridine 5-carboxymethylaminomethyl modification enzyme